MNTLKNTLKRLKTLQNSLPPMDLNSSPENPVDLFEEWLNEAIKNSAEEPHAMTLSTVDEYGMPDARVLILKNIDEHGWQFASSATSQKGIQISHVPMAALTFYWPSIARSIRVRGKVFDLGAKIGRDDFLNRSKSAKEIALMGNQSSILVNEGKLEEKLNESKKIMNESPTSYLKTWRVYSVKPSTIEFWQGDISRCHQRIRYVREETGLYQKELLWP